MAELQDCRIAVIVAIVRVTQIHGYNPRNVIAQTFIPYQMRLTPYREKMGSADTIGTSSSIA
jgi:hypothetical protein